MHEVDEQIYTTWHGKHYTSISLPDFSQYMGSADNLSTAAYFSFGHICSQKCSFSAARMSISCLELLLNYQTVHAMLRSDSVWYVHHSYKVSVGKYHQNGQMPDHHISDPTSPASAVLVKDLQYENYHQYTFWCVLQNEQSLQMANDHGLQSFMSAWFYT